MVETTMLGKRVTELPAAPDRALLDTFPNTHPDRPYTINFECPEFTAICPVTGQPDFAKILIEYQPDKLCVELKSLKFYMFSFRNHGIFHENVTNRILDDLVATLKPRSMTVIGDFGVRGGIYTKVTASYKQGDPLPQ
jgi:7-cyano-7-deazaguanine reductase